MQIPKIVTKRLILRRFLEEDLDEYAQICADAEMMQYIGTGKTLNRSESWKSMATMLGHWQLRGYGMWAVENRQTGEMLGRVGCLQPEGWLDFEIGWTIARKYWGCGFATEAGQAAIAFAFEELQRPYIISLIRPQNLASRRVAEKLGEKLVGSTEVFGNETVIYKITQEEWLQNNRCY